MRGRFYTTFWKSDPSFSDQRTFYGSKEAQPFQALQPLSLGPVGAPVEIGFLPRGFATDGG